MKNIAVILLMLTFLAYSAKTTTYYVYYEIDKEAIADFFCINKDKPEMACDGKCHLKKVVKKTEKETEENPVSRVNEEETSIFIPSKFLRIDIQKDYSSTKYFSFYTNFYQFTSYKHLLKPPSFLVNQV